MHVADHAFIGQPGEDLLLILQTPVSPARQGGLHIAGVYLLWASMAGPHVFDYRASDVYWCAADIGWVTARRQAVYVPLANDATMLMVQSVRNYRNHSRV